MKKLLLTFGLFASMAAASLSAEKPTNEAFYLIGSFNDWNPATEANHSKYPYKLTDEDGDGLYTGTFDI